MSLLLIVDLGLKLHKVSWVGVVSSSRTVKKLVVLFFHLIKIMFLTTHFSIKNLDERQELNCYCQETINLLFLFCGRTGAWV